MQNICRYYLNQTTDNISGHRLKLIVINYIDYRECSSHNYCLLLGAFVRFGYWSPTSMRGHQRYKYNQPKQIDIGCNDMQSICLMWADCYNTRYGGSWV